MHSGESRMPVQRRPSELVAGATHNALHQLHLTPVVINEKTIVLTCSEFGGGIVVESEVEVELEMMLVLFRASQL